MPGQVINIGSIVADLDVNSGNMVRGLTRGQEALDRITAEMKLLDAQLKSGAISLQTYTQQTSQLTAVAANLAHHMALANGALSVTSNALGVLNSRTQQFNQSAGRMAQGMMQLGYIADDLQYGFSAIVNNIAPLVFGLTGNAGLAAAAQLAAVAANQLYKVWDEVKTAFGDTSVQATARQSIEELGDAVKKLQEDVNNFSWRELIAQKLGFDPDAGTRSMLESKERALKDRKEAVTAADKAEKFEDPEVKKEKDRFDQAVGESMAKVKEQGFRDVTDKLGAKILEKSGGDLSGFMPKDDYLKNPLTDKRLPGAVSSAEQYQELKDRTAKGEDIGEGGRSLKNSLEETARARLRDIAHERLGDASGDIKKAGTIGDLLGGPEGDVIAGRKQTEKARLESDKETDEYARKSKELRKGQVKDFIEKAVPDLKSLSDKLAFKEDTGGITEVNRKAELRKILDKGDLPKVISEGEREKAIQDEIDRTAKEDPESRRKRVEGEALAKVNELSPKHDVKGKASRIAQDVYLGKTKEEDARNELASKLIESGLGREDAMTAAGPLMAEAKKEEPKARQRRLKREALGKADEAVPELSDAVESALARGIDPAKVRKGLEERLKKENVGDEDAMQGAELAVSRGQESIRERLANLQAGGHGKLKHGPSEVSATSQLTQKVQAGVGADSELKKTNTLLEKQRVLLEKIAGKSTLHLELK